MKVSIWYWSFLLRSHAKKASFVVKPRKYYFHAWKNLHLYSPPRVWVWCHNGAGLVPSNWAWNPFYSHAMNPFFSLRALGTSWFLVRLYPYMFHTQSATPFGTRVTVNKLRLTTSLYIKFPFKRLFPKQFLVIACAYADMDSKNPICRSIYVRHMLIYLVRVTMMGMDHLYC